MTLPEHTRQPLGPNQERWIQALESGKYEQGQGVLHSDNDEFCCLGVACDIANIPAVKEGTLPHWAYGSGGESITRLNAPPSLVEWLGLHDQRGGTASGPSGVPLTKLNDDGLTFEQIAGLIRQDPSVYFKEPR